MSDLDEHREGLAHDLPGLLVRGLGRRGVLGLLGGIGAGLVSCSVGEDDAVDGTSTPDPPPGSPPGAEPTTVAEGEIPEETAGPFPGDGSNGPDVLSQSGVVREDITRAFGTAAGVAAGVPLTLRLRVLQLEDGESTPLVGAAVYAWHCDRKGRYSMYSDGVTEENYLRGVQAAGADGWLRFTTVFPGCYAGRWPHVHFEVYPSLDAATTASDRLRTSQLALPEDTCRQVYGVADGYDQSVGNLDRVSLDSDNVFSDGYSLQLAKVTGSVEEGYVATIAVPV
jgi:protocatechuate 3,4-dioxygenase beta subunit